MNSLCFHMWRSLREIVILAKSVSLILLFLSLGVSVLASLYSLNAIADLHFCRFKPHRVIEMEFV